MMTLDEMERRAYVSGNTELSVVLGAAIDLSRLATDGHEADVCEDVCEEADDIERELYQMKLILVKDTRC